MSESSCRSVASHSAFSGLLRPVLAAVVLMVWFCSSEAALAQGTDAQQPDASIVVPQVREKLLPIIALQCPPSADAKLQLVFDENGYVITCVVTAVESGRKVFSLSPFVLWVVQPELKGQTREISFTAKEIAEARQKAVTPPPSSSFPEGDAVPVLAFFRKAQMGVLSQYMTERRAVDIELWINAEGKVIYAMAYKGGMSHAVAPLTDADRKRLTALIRQLGDDRYDAREAASEALRQFGKASVSMLKEVLAGNPEPEVAHRLRRIIPEIDDVLETPRLAEMLLYLRALNFPDAALHGKRYMLSFAATEINAPRRRVLRPGAEQE